MSCGACRTTNATRTQDWRSPMPMVNVRLIEGVFTPSQKQEMVRKLTDAMVSIEGENMRQYTLVVIDEVKSGDWGIGGNPLTTNAVKALAAGKSNDHEGCEGACDWQVQTLAPQ